MRWRANVFEPLVQTITERFGGDPIQGYCNFLHHRYSLATAQRRDVPNDEAFDAWEKAGLPGISP
jgi:hypothetical protein